MYWSRFFVTIFFILSPPKVLSFSFYSPTRWHLKHASTFFCDVAWCPKTMHSRPFRIGTGGRKIPESSEKYDWVRFKMIVCSTQVLLIDRLDREHGENNVSWLENKDLPQCNEGEQWGFAVFALSQQSQISKQVWGKFCDYFCTEDILDLCDVNSLPAMDKWNSQKPHGMFWRMQVRTNWTINWSKILPQRQFHLLTYVWKVRLLANVATWRSNCPEVPVKGPGRLSNGEETNSVVLC